MSDNVEAVCNAGGDSGAQTITEINTSPPVQNTGDNVVVPPIDASSESNAEQKVSSSSPIVEPQSPEKEESNKSSENTIKQNGKESSEVSKLELEIQKRIHERDNYKKKLTDTERRLNALQASYNAVTSGEGDEITLRREKEDLKNMLTQTQLMLDDRGRLITNQQTQISALSKQVSSLKEVVAITKDLLNIRNMEVKHLQDDVDSMESKITAEREKHNLMMNKMDSAVRLNADLKKEYETQLHLFQDLRGKYEQKVTLLSEENRALEAANQSAVV
ncbi:ELKS/Rab6-interacting/CAST family member 1 [Neodiprion pinetum]|uniref:ELKS/Rab6-interacting/CAST family member 1 n=1 Tax=Neodiprion pinetum TaxID=441929 RepID=UPI001EDD78F0|nr:uncharacterized protein LOC124223482 [Neodiprion pinetum]XP_046491448.1 uncharacterized protein LOC124223482 [Neodiprion pinetum]